jgi:HK97 family phage prohead protease/HK97 family phage major capsid protein
MTKKIDKLLYLSSKFTASTETDDSIYIEGYASTVDRDRQGDVIPMKAWNEGLSNYLKNPIILAYHNHQMPIGKMVEHKVTDQGLWVRAQIPQEVGDVYKLIKKGILSAFSVGFRVRDADYDSASESFLIKELELHEISVVSVPANQNTLFSLAKAFDNATEFELYKQQFAPAPVESAKKLDTPKAAKSTTKEEWDMDPKELEKLLADAAAKAAEQTAKAVLEAQTKAAEEAQRKLADEEALQAKIKAAVSAVTPAAPVVQTVDTGAERLLSDIEKRLEDQATEHRTALEGLESAIKEKAKELEALQNKSGELEALQRSRMQFTEPAAPEIAYLDKEKAVLISKILRRPMQDTKFGKAVLEKAAASFGGTARMPNTNTMAEVWEQEISTTLESEMRRQLVVAGAIRSTAMSNPVMRIPVNPDTSDNADWVIGSVSAGVAESANYSAGASSGTARTHQLKEVILTAYKLATKEYIAFEEDEDSLIPVLPLVRDALSRRMAKSLDTAMLIGAGVGGTVASGIATLSPIKGLSNYDLVGGSPNVTLATTSTALTVAKVMEARKRLGAWGLNPSELLIFVTTTGYYELLEDTNFLTVDKVGPNATLLTGQIGSIGNTPVLVSPSFPSTAVAGGAAAVIVNPRNFLVGQHRGMRLDSDDFVVEQRSVLVASMRIGMTQLSTTDGEGAVTVRYVA